MRNTGTLEEEEVTQNEQEPQPDSSTPTPTPEPETTALVPAEPDVIEGEVIEIEPPETSEDHTPPKQKPYWLLVPFTILVCFSMLAISLELPLLTPSATVTILPVERSITTLATIQVQGRQVAPLTLSQSATVPATGKRHRNATQAHGTITFYNGLFTFQTITAGTILTGNDGVQIITDQAAIIPAGNPPIYGHVTVSAHALRTGQQGNIAAFDINQACCLASVLAKNTQAFTGGASARDFIVVTNEDIQYAVSPLKTTLLKSEQAALGAQIIAGEALTPPLCSENVTSDHRPGDEKKEVTVSVSETCTGIAYAAHDAYQHATRLITSDATGKLGTHYALVGDIQFKIVQAKMIHPGQGRAMFLVQVTGTWVYQITKAIQKQLLHLIAGKSKQQALALLFQQPGIQAASITSNAAMLPNDLRRITIIIVYRSA